MNELTPNATKPKSLRELLQTLGNESRSGLLEVTGKGLMTQLHFREGQLINAFRLAGSELWPLGDYLIDSGTLSPRQLVKASDYARKKRLKVEEAIIHKRYASEHVLQRFTELDVAEIIYPLFRQEDITARFVKGQPKSSRFITPIPVGFLLKEEARRRMAWTAFQNEVGSVHAIYDRDRQDLARMLCYVDDFKELATSITPAARVVFYFINGKKTLQQVARASGMGTFKTFEAYRELLTHDLLTLVTPTGEGEAPASRRSYLRFLIPLFSYSVLALLIILSVSWISDNSEHLTARLDSTNGLVGEQASESDIMRISHQLDAYELEIGRYPSDLNGLIAAGYGTGLSLNALKTLHYIEKDGGYTIQKPTTAR